MDGLDVETGLDPLEALPEGDPSPEDDGDEDEVHGAEARARLRQGREPARGGGPLGVPRDWCASVGLDPETGLAWAGGYVGDGVATTNLAGRTLRDLVLGRDTELTRLPWVGHRSRPWEPEPLRWLGINAALRATAVADVEERLTRHASVVARAVGRFVG